MLLLLSNDESENASRNKIDIGFTVDMAIFNLASWRRSPTTLKRPDSSKQCHTLQIAKYINFCLPTLKFYFFSKEM